MTLTEELEQKRRQRIAETVKKRGGSLSDELAILEGRFDDVSPDFMNQTADDSDDLKMFAADVAAIHAGRKETQPEPHAVEPDPNQDFDFNALEMLKNVPSSAARYAKGIYNTVTNPVRTGQALIDMAESGSEKVGRKLAEVTTGQEIAPKDGAEDIANAVIDAAINRYGSIDNLQRTVQEDPIGFLADISAVVPPLLPGKYGKVAALTEPTTMTGKTVRTVAKNVIPEAQARKLYDSAAKFSTTLTRKERAELVDTALKHNVRPTAAGTATVEDRIAALNQSLNSMIAESTASGVRIPVQAVFTHLNKLRSEKGGFKIEATDDLAAINRIAKEFHLGLKGKKTVTPEELQKFKIDVYEKINWDAKRNTGTPIREDTLKAFGRGAKDALANVIKEAPEINQALSELYELQPHLIRAANRIENHNLISINTPLNTGVGGMVGDVVGSSGAGLTAGFITAVLGNPKMKTAVAIALNKIKQGDIGWLDANKGRAEVVVALALASRAEELVSDQEKDQ